MASFVDLDGGSGRISPPQPGGAPGGGGTPGTQTGSSLFTNLPFGENGGVFGSTYFLMVPVQDISSGNCYIGFFDTTNYDDQVDGGAYAFRPEDIKYDRVPTVNRVIITYRDLGLATINVTLKYVNDDGIVKVTTVPVSIGTVVASNALLTRFVDIQATGFRPQLIITRATGSGPMDITHVTLRGEVEDNT